MYIYNRCCPIQRVKFKNNYCHKPWFSKGLDNACKKKNSVYKSLLKHKTEKAEVKYKKYKNKLNSILRKAEKSYYCRKLEEYRNNVKNTWKILNEVTRRKSKSKQCQKEFISEGVMITDGKTISNKFNEFFTNIGPNLAKKIKQNLDNKLVYFHGKPSDKFYGSK